MKVLLLGLGNPGLSFLYTRHNVGFSFLDFSAKLFSLSFKKFNNFEYTELKIGENDFILVKPLTYMNLSGNVFPTLFNKFYVSLDELIVITDNIDLSLGRVKFKKKGSPQTTHNGLKSINFKLGTPHYKRIYIGILNEAFFDIKKYVLSNFKSEERERLENLYAFLSKTLFQMDFNNLDLIINEINSSVF